METITLNPITAGAAAAEMWAAGLVDPDGQYTPESLAGSGQAFRLVTAAGSGVFVCEKRKNHLWIHGAAASGSAGLTADGMALFERMAQAAGCEFVAFETHRPGLMKLAKKGGYRVQAVILKKKVSS